MSERGAQHGKKPRRRRRRKPIAEIEAGTEAIVSKGRGARGELSKLIMTIGNLSVTERQQLLLAANKALAQTIESVGFQALLLKTQWSDAGAKTARRGNSRSAAAWHTVAWDLADLLWRDRPVFFDNADKTAKEIYDDFDKACQELGIKTPQPGTVAKFLAATKSK